MTDKELRKLSRLELLELLLEASKENEKLIQQINSLKAENEAADTIEKLSSITAQVESALRYADNVVSVLGRTSQGSAASAEVGDAGPYESNEAELMSDVEIYKAILRFFADNDDKLRVFPSYIGNALRARIRSVLERSR